MHEEFYEFSGRPFQLTPDPEFYFESATHRKALSYLGYGLAQGEGFVVVTGEVGAGKSTLVAHLMATIDRARQTAGQIVTSALDGSEMIHVAAQCFGLDVAGRDKASALKAIELFLHGEARAGRRCLLVVDEAQNLSIEALEELRMLSNFQLGSHPLLQTLLLGQPEFRSVLAHSDALEQLRQRVIASHHLEAMEPSEVGAYVEHRLARVGWRGNPEIDPGLYPELARATDGVPRRVNQIMARLLLLGSVEQRQRIDPAMLDAVLADLARDSTNPAAVAVAAPVPAAEAPVLVAFPPKHDRHLATELSPATQSAGPAMAEFEAALATRDALIAELQDAVIELSDAGKAAAPAAAGHEPGRFLDLLAGLEARINAIESRLSEQEQTLRHALTMMIEMVEDDEQRRRAA
ncbi:AAA family ATPase [Novosphingobium sp. Gsoil 351]|uniref:AAA family ATPase n=1 Tax=Novosphingobium sp. Gsoil 351 TaxID=2675225 RepID=UPI0012B4D692|nr:AAA family ATPase [Novosphingobium sp. Gsoil 351]QGN53208.1 AAA family ATPase [Novosphingobium sp. Gsoil 351]